MEEVYTLYFASFHLYSALQIFNIGEEVDDFEIIYVYERHRAWEHIIDSFAWCLIAVCGELTKHQYFANVSWKEVVRLQDTIALKMGDEVLATLCTTNKALETVRIEELFYRLYCEWLLKLLAYYQELLANASDPSLIDAEDEDIYQIIADLITNLSVKDYETHELIDVSASNLKDIWIKNVQFLVETFMP